MIIKYIYKAKISVFFHILKYFISHSTISTVRDYLAMSFSPSSRLDFDGEFPKEFLLCLKILVNYNLFLVVLGNNGSFANLFFDK